MASTRLTNDMRNAFIAKVMEDVPQVDYEQKIRDTVNKAALAALPRQVKALYDNPDTREYVNTASAHVYRSDQSIPRSMSFRLPARNDKDLERIVRATSGALVDKWIEQENQRRSLREKLRAVAFHCTTLKQLADSFPEFARYLPKDELDATRNLPALANVVSDFVKAGWPKGKRAAA